MSESDRRQLRRSSSSSCHEGEDVSVVTSVLCRLEVVSVCVVVTVVAPLVVETGTAVATGAGVAVGVTTGAGVAWTGVVAACRRPRAARRGLSGAGPASARRCGAATGRAGEAGTRARAGRASSLPSEGEASVTAPWVTLATWSRGDQTPVIRPLDSQPRTRMATASVAAVMMAAERSRGSVKRPRSRDGVERIYLVIRQRRPRLEL